MPLKVQEVNEQTGFVVATDECGNGDGYQIEMISRRITDFPSDAVEAKAIIYKWQKYADKYRTY